MEIINPKEHLLVFAMNAQAGRYEENYNSINIFSQYNKKNIYYIGSASSCQGLREVDILFCREWWRRKDADSILEVIGTYIYSGTGRIIGGRDHIPLSLWDSYDKYRRKNKEIEDSKKYSRFELLDIR